MKKRMVLVFAAFTMFFGTMFASQPADAFLGGSITNSPTSDSWIRISNSWPAGADHLMTIGPGQRSRDYSVFHDVDGFFVASGCYAYNEANGIFWSGGVWHKIQDYQAFLIEVYC